MLASRIQQKIKIIIALIAVSASMVVPVLTPVPAFAQTTSVTVKTNDCRVPYSQLNSSNCGIIKMIVIITNIMSAMVGVVIVISIIWAGIQYSASKSDPNAVARARARISNAILALFLYIFMFAFLQWAVPGGAF